MRNLHVEIGPKDIFEIAFKESFSWHANPPANKILQKIGALNHSKIVKPKRLKGNIKDGPKLLIIDMPG